MSFKYLLAALLLFSTPELGCCGVVADGTMGSATVQTGSNYSITAGRKIGSNLFHSFSQFSLVAGEKAIFSGSTGISSIISRVTGGASSINGTISSTIAGADLYLVNPAGIAFGPNARLDVSGSFHASAADYIALGSSGRFPSDPAATINLTVDPPTAFGFLKSPSPVTLNGSLLIVPKGKNISLTSGNITLTNANLWSYNGTVALVSLASPGEVNVGTFAATASTLGTISLSEIARTSIPRYTGTAIVENPGMRNHRVANIDASGSGGGKVFISGGALYMTGALIYNDTYGAVPGSKTDISVTGRMELNSNSLITGNGMTGSTASGASISLAAGDILIRNGFVNTNSYNAVTGANLSISSSGDLVIDGNSWVAANASGVGRAGSLFIDAKKITIANGSLLSSSAPVIGAGLTSGAGSITLQAAESLSLSGQIKSENAEGTAGNISITSPVLTLSGTGVISCSLLTNLSSETRRSGNIIIETGKLSLLDNGRIDTRVYYSKSGSSGDIRIKTGTLSLSGGGAISSSIDSASGNGGNIVIDASESISVTSLPINQLKEIGSIASDSTAGNAGHITLNAPLVTVTGGGSVTTIAQGGSGRGGDITVTASERIVVDGGNWSTGSSKRSALSTDTFGSGKGGNISLSAPDIVISTGGLVSSIAEAGSSGAGGNIGIKGGRSVTVQGAGGGNPSRISVETGGVGDAGTITVAAPLLTIADGGVISAAALSGSRGNGGLITISATERLAVSGGAITGGITGNTASSGNGARIEITAPSVEVANGGFITAETGSASSGRGGDVTISGSSLLFSGGRVSSATKGSGNAGTVKLDGNEIIINSGGTVSSSAEAGSSGAGGNIGIKGGRSITVQGAGGVNPSRISVETGGYGDAGTITVAAPLLTIADGGVISAAALSGSRGNGGLITISATERLAVSGGTTTGGITGNTVSSGNGARIEITAPSVEVAAGGFITAETGSGSSGKGGDVTISGNSILISGGRVSSSTKSSGNAGTIKLEGNEIIINSGGTVSSSAEVGSSGAGGNIGIKGGRLITVQGAGGVNPSRISVETGGVGDAGTISIAAPLLTVADGGVISAAALSGSRGNGGQIEITAPSVEVAAGGFITAETGSGSSGKGGDVTISGNSLLFSGGRVSSATKGSGNAGTIKLDGQELGITAGGMVSTSAESGSSGSAGNIEITVAGGMKVQGVSANGIESQVTSSTSGIGAAGGITIASASLDVTGGGIISTSAEEGSSGRGGHISVNTGDFQLLNGGAIRTRSAGAGNAGDIAVTANSLIMKGGAILDSSSGHALSMPEEAGTTGSAGNINVSIMKDARISESMVTTQSATSEGGNIIFSAKGWVTVDHGELSASATAGAGNGGNVTLNGGTIILRRGKVTAQAERGDGGNLDIHADLLVASSDSLISASSRFGAQGTVLIDAPAVDVGAALVRHPGDFLDMDAFMPKRCTTVGDDNLSVLMLFGGDSPPAPAALLPLITPQTESDQNRHL